MNERIEPPGEADIVSAYEELREMCDSSRSQISDRNRVLKRLETARENHRIECCQLV